MPKPTDGVKRLVENASALTGGPADLPPLPEGLSLRVHEGGAVRVGNSRVSLDLVIEQHEKYQLTPEAIVRAYDTLQLSDVRAVIAYYNAHRAVVRAYLDRRSAEAETLRREIEAEHPRIAREVLLERRRARGIDHAPTGQ